MADAVLTASIVEIHAVSRRSYGAPRVHAELRLRLGVRCGRKRVARLMRAAGVAGICHRRKRGRDRPLPAPHDDLSNAASAPRDPTSCGPPTSPSTPPQLERSTLRSDRRPLADDRRVGDRRSHAHRTRRRRPADGAVDTPACAWGDPACRTRIAIHLMGVRTPVATGTPPHRYPRRSSNGSRPGTTPDAATPASPTGPRPSSNTFTEPPLPRHDQPTRMCSENRVRLQGGSGDQLHVTQPRALRAPTAMTTAPAVTTAAPITTRRPPGPATTVSSNVAPSSGTVSVSGSRYRASCRWGPCCPASASPAGPSPLAPCRPRSGGAWRTRPGSDHRARSR
nr:IS3 family transposase [Pseudonocardia sp. KRD291]